MPHRHQYSPSLTATVGGKFGGLIDHDEDVLVDECDLMTVADSDDESTQVIATVASTAHNSVAVSYETRPRVADVEASALIKPRVWLMLFSMMWVMGDADKGAGPAMRDAHVCVFQ